jgi:hypothetical protein
MNLDELIIARFCVIDELLPRVSGRRLCQHGSEPDRLAHRKSSGRSCGSQVKQRAALLSQCLQEMPHQASCSFEAAGLDFFKQLLTFMNTGLPSREHVGRIGVKDTAEAGGVGEETRLA